THDINQPHLFYPTRRTPDSTAKTNDETHKHTVEQFGVVVKGSLAMVVAGDQRILMVGDTFRIPAGTAHGARVFEEPTQVVQVFAPPRTDLPRPSTDGPTIKT